jgi:hypothetical protein
MEGLIARIYLKKILSDLITMHLRCPAFKQNSIKIISVAVIDLIFVYFGMYGRINQPNFHFFIFPILSDDERNIFQS